MIVKGRLKIRGCGYVARMTPLLAMLALLANDTHSTDTAAAADTHSADNKQPASHSTSLQNTR